MVQDNMVQKKFPNLLTTSNMRWIKQKATLVTPSKEAEKTCEKLMIPIEKSKIPEE